MRRRGLLALMGVAAFWAAAMVWAPTSSLAGEKEHRLTMQIDTMDKATIDLVLSNVVNVVRNMSAAGKEVEIEVVAYGPGVNMLRADKSQVAAKIKSISESIPNVTFLACGTTINAMHAAEKKDIPLLPEAKVVPGGVIHLMERQEQGWSYIRP